MKKSFFSIVIPVKEINQNLLEEVIPALKKQTDTDFQLILVPDRAKEVTSLPGFAKVFPSWPETGPAQKRDLGVRKSRGKVVVFLDDDAYPGKDWLKNARPYFKNKAVAAVCGPGVTPSNDPLLSKVSGWMWASFLGAGGAGTYRCRPGKKREVDDFPSFNLMVKKTDFLKVGGFDTGFWPGEDTKLCHDLVYKLGKKIIYDPLILVYHHRRKIFKDHLKQIGRYGFHRGYFVKILPKTSRRIGYFYPLTFFLAVALAPLVYLILSFLNLFFLAEIVLFLYLACWLTYLLLLFLTGIWVWLMSKDWRISILVMPTILLSHLFYGLMFLRGLFKRNFKSRYGREVV